MNIEKEFEKEFEKLWNEQGVKSSQPGQELIEIAFKEIAMKFYSQGFYSGLETSKWYVNPLEVSADIIGIVEGPFMNIGMMVYEMKKLITKYDELGGFVE